MTISADLKLAAASYWEGCVHFAKIICSEQFLDEIESDIAELGRAVVNVAWTSVCIIALVVMILIPPVSIFVNLIVIRMDRAADDARMRARAERGEQSDLGDML